MLPRMGGLKLGSAGALLSMSMSPSRRWKGTRGSTRMLFTQHPLRDTSSSVATTPESARSGSVGARKCRLACSEEM